MPSNPFARGKTINVPKGKKKGDVFKRGNKKYLVVSYIHPSSGNRVRYGKPVKGIASGSAKTRKKRKSRKRNPGNADMLLAGNPRIARWGVRRRMARMPLPMKRRGSRGRPFGGWGRRNPLMDDDLAMYDDLAGMRNPRPKKRKAAAKRKPAKRKATKRKSAKRKKSGPVTVTFKRDAKGRKLRKAVKVTFKRKTATPAQKRKKKAQGKRLAKLGKPYRFKKGQKPPKKGQKLKAVGKKRKATKKRKTTKRKAATKKVTIPKGKKKGQKFTKKGVQYVVKTRKTKAGGVKRYASKV